MEVETRTDPLAAAIARAVGLVREGSVIGVGAGSASTAFLRSLAARVDDGLRVEIVAASEELADLARELGVPVGDLRGGIDLTIDGADEVSPSLNWKRYGYDEA
jgi:ribose 5-phosphate isomerase A